MATQQQPIRVGAREFRESLAEHLDSPAPIAITRHGRTVGYYVPVRRKLDEQEMTAFRQAVDELRALMAEHGISEDDVVAEFQARRRSCQ